MPPPEVRTPPEGARYGIVSVGSCHGAVLEALDHFAAQGEQYDYMRVRGFPFNETVEDFLAAHEVNFVVEQNRDGQLRGLLVQETRCPKDKLVSVLFYGGLPLSRHHVVDGIQAQMSAGLTRTAAAGEVSQG